MITERVWNLTFDTTTNVVDVYIKYGLGASANYCNLWCRMANQICSYLAFCRW